MLKGITPVRVGVTGGIGAGKSTICHVLMNLNIPVYNADDRARSLMNSEPEVIKQLKRSFSDSVYKDGQLDRDFLAKEVFHYDQRLKELNDIVHPAVKEDFEKWAGRQNKEPIIVKEAALLFEAGTYRDLDQTILVYCPLEIRINRILLRDPFRTRTEIEKIIERQWSDQEKKKLADFIITNDDIKPVMPQVLEILDRIRGQGNRL